jgi:NAD(P) transhydrogenase subunit beta
MMMCKAMNRSLSNVLFAASARRPPPALPERPRGAAKNYREVSVDDAAVLLANVQSLIIVPGYGMAVAQAQHTVRELADLLGKKGVDVKYAIHPSRAACRAHERAARRGQRALRPARSTWTRSTPSSHAPTWRW